MPDPQTTQQIQGCLDRLRAGDESARDGLLEAACERLRALTHRMLRDYPGVRRWEQTDDVAQNAAVRLCRALREVRPPTPRDFFAVAALQVRRELIDLARHYAGPLGLGANHASQAANGRNAGDTPSPFSAAADSTLDPVRLAAWAEFHCRADALPEEERAVFDLLWYQELSQAEAAELLGISESTVKRRWQSARLRLSDQLGGKLPF
jgi:RNA polymerase sigma-70 factor (ECF subfamily)